MSRSQYMRLIAHSHAIIINIYNTKSSFSAADRGTILARSRYQKYERTLTRCRNYIGKYTIQSFTLEINNASTGERKH